MPRFGPRIADRSSTRAQVRNFLEGLLWIALATFIVWYGNGRESLVAVVQDAEQVYARYLVAWAVGVCINTAIFLYIAVFVPLVRGDKREWEQTAPWAIPTASLVGVLCFVCFTIGMWLARGSNGTYAQLGHAEIERAAAADAASAGRRYEGRSRKVGVVR